jgi:hypothetical protein
MSAILLEQRLRRVDLEELSDAERAFILRRVAARQEAVGPGDVHEWWPELYEATYAITDPDGRPVGVVTTRTAMLAGRVGPAR